MSASHRPRLRGDARALTPGERALAAGVFGDALAAEAVTLHRAKWWMWQPAWITMAPDGDIWFHPNSAIWCADFSVQPIWARALLIHELTHCWQHQTGINLVLRRPPFARYRYTFVPGKPFAAYGLEQQASIVEDAYRRRAHGDDDLPAYTAINPFIARSIGRSPVTV